MVPLVQVYTTAAMDGIMSEVLVCIKFVNLSSNHISNLQLNLSDSGTLKMVRMVSGVAVLHIVACF